MTFLEKALEMEHENNSTEVTEEDIIINSCPSYYGFEENCYLGCEECWNREMPDTEPKTPEELYAEIEKSLKERIGSREYLKRVNAYGDAIADAYYNEGMKDVWELLKKLEVIDADELRKMFGFSNDTFHIFQKIYDNFTPQEAIAKLKAYEEAQIEVGDVVTYAGEKCVVLELKGDMVVVLTSDGCVLEWHKCDVEKTGKHIDIQSILESIGE